MAEYHAAIRAMAVTAGIGKTGFKGITEPRTPIADHCRAQNSSQRD